MSIQVSLCLYITDKGFLRPITILEGKNSQITDMTADSEFLSWNETRPFLCRLCTNIPMQRNSEELY